jgi:hypothetical protein
MPRLLIVLAATLFSVQARADRMVRETASERGRAGTEHRHLVFVTTNPEERAIVDLAVFSSKDCTLRVIDNPSGTTLTELGRREKIIAGVNGGYFDADFAPIGLRIVNGKTIAPLRRAKLLTGILIASSHGVQILRPREFSPGKKADAAIQCGPFLVDGGARVRGLDDSRFARRTFAAVSLDNRAALGVCSDVSLARLAEILAATPNFPINRALNLDGGSSSAFWFARENESALSILEQKPVRDFVAVVSR